MKIYKTGILFFLFCILFASCNTTENIIYKPYLVKGEMELCDNEEENGFAVLDLDFYNKAQKKVVSFDLNFFLFDEDGNPASCGNPEISVCVEEDVDPEEKINISFPLDKYLKEIPDAPYEVEYMFVSRILYADGDEWKDLLGLKAY